jgi:hypothetical protein
MDYIRNYISTWQFYALFRAKITLANLRAISINHNLELDFLEAAFQKRSAKIIGDCIPPTRK